MQCGRAIHFLRDFVVEMETHIIVHIFQHVDELILQHEPVLPEAQFLARPAGCSWEHLHIQIRTDSRYEVLDAGKDVIIAWYENELGHLISKKKSIMLERLPKFCRNGKGIQIYALLKSFAAHGGRDDASQYPNKNLANQVRKNLREYLCVLFGYSHSESPIEQETKAKADMVFKLILLHSYDYPHVALLLRLHSAFARIGVQSDLYLLLIILHCVLCVDVRLLYMH